MTTTDKLIEVLGNAFSYGHAQAQVPHMTMWLGEAGGVSKEEAQRQANNLWKTLAQAVKDGLVAWKVANPNAKTGKVIYTEEPRNPETKRLVSAYPWMTPLAIVQYGPELYQRYVEAIKAREASFGGNQPTLSEDDFRRSVLVDSVPASPAYASQVPADILALTKPVKPQKIKPTIGADGFVSALGPRQTSALIYGDEKGQALLDQLEKLKVGPSTVLDGSDHSQAVIAMRVLSKAGGAGVAWLASRQFPLTGDTYHQALSGGGGVDVLDALEAAGVDPGAVTENGNLWNFIADARRWNADVVQWAKARQVSWNEPDDKGDLPLAGLLHKICTEAGMVDFMRPGGAGINKLEQTAMNAVFKMIGLQGEIDETNTEIDFLEGLALEMVRSGVDLSHKNKRGMALAGNIYPEQTSATRRLFEFTDPASLHRERDAMQALMFGDREKIKRDPAAYGARALAFVRKLEEASGQSLLDTPVVSKRPSPRP